MAGRQPLSIGVLASGRGSNLVALLEAIDRGELAATVTAVGGNRPEAPALRHAAERGLPVVVAPRPRYSSRAAQQRALAEGLKQYGTELLVLAGFDQILTGEFIAAFRDRIINVHPSLLPAFAGTLHAQAEAWHYGVKIAGCTVHFVTEDVDAGPIILQGAVPVLDGDTPESLAARILREEHRLLPKAVHLFAQGKLRIDGRRVLGAGPADSVR